MGKSGKSSNQAAKHGSDPNQGVGISKIQKAISKKEDGDRPLAWSAAATREVQLLVDDFINNLNYNAGDIIKYSNSDTFTKKLAVAATKALCAGPLASRAHASGEKAVNKYQHAIGKPESAPQAVPAQ